MNYELSHHISSQPVHSIRSDFSFQQTAMFKVQCMTDSNVRHTELLLKSSSLLSI